MQQNAIGSLKSEQVYQQQSLQNVTSTAQDGFMYADHVSRDQKHQMKTALYQPPVITAGHDSRRLSRHGRLRSASIDSLSPVMPPLAHCPSSKEDHQMECIDHDERLLSPPSSPPTYAGIVNADIPGRNRYPTTKLVPLPAFNPNRYSAWKRDIAYWRSLYQYVPEDKIISALGLNANDQLQRVMITFTKATRTQIEK